MDYHLDKEIRLNNKTEYESLYSWCLQEINSEGEQVGRDLIPWRWGLYFTASELRLHQSVKGGTMALLRDEGPENIEEFRESEIIIANLHPGICDDGRWLKDDVRYSMLGTDRKIEDFTLRVDKIGKDENKERCGLLGWVSYTAEVADFCHETTADNVMIHLRLSENKFNKLKEIVNNDTVDILRVMLAGVDGFYSEWSPSITTNSIKVLTHDDEHKVVKPDGCDIDPPRLLKVGEFELTLIKRYKLNPKQNLETLNISSLFNESLENTEDEPEVEEQSITANVLMAKIAQNQAEIMRIKKPLWLIVAMLVFIYLALIW